MDRSEDGTLVGDAHRVVVIEDDPDDAGLLTMFLQAGRPTCVVHRCATMTEAELALAAEPAGLVFVDLGLPDSQGAESVVRTRRAAGDAPVIAITGDDRGELGVAALEAGAQDYLVKDQFSIDLLHRAVRYAATRARVEAQLRATAFQLQRSNRDLDDYASIVAHDLRSPIRTASLFLDRYCARVVPKDPADPEIDKLTQGLRGSLDRLQATVGGILRLAQLRSSAGPGAGARAEVAPVAEAVLADLRADFEAVGAIGAVRGTATVRCDPQALTEVLRNLVENALKYRAPERSPVIELTSHQAAGRARICVTDNGVGIQPEDRDRAFHLFERLHTGTQPGLGLGLTICARVLEANDGRIGIEARQDGRPGTTMTIELPVPGLVTEPATLRIDHGSTAD